MAQHVGFLFNHVAGHQVAHALPIALAMRRFRPEIAITLFCAPKPLAAVRSILSAADAGDPGLKIETLRPPHRAATWAHKSMLGAAPIDRVAMLAANRHKFARLAALVTPEKTSLLLKSLFGMADLRLIHTRHGAGDLPVGFNSASGRFDFVLISGEKVRDQLQDKGLLKPEAYAIVGYPKFEQFPDQQAPALFSNNRPTVVYNPHPSPVFSSWFAMGEQVLDYFARSDRYNLIFAPHVTLFRKRVSISTTPLGIARVPDVAERFYQCPNILIDKGSAASMNMSYTNAADIYLGDASSQIYEFLRRPRPCVFLDVRGRRARAKHPLLHMEAGHVIACASALDAALARAVEDQARYRAVQKRMFDYTFSMTREQPSMRAARAIVEFLRSC